MNSQIGKSSRQGVWEGLPRSSSEAYPCPLLLLLVGYWSVCCWHRIWLCDQAHSRPSRTQSGPPALPSWVLGLQVCLLGQYSVSKANSRCCSTWVWLQNSQLPILSRAGITDLDHHAQPKPRLFLSFCGGFIRPAWLSKSVAIMILQIDPHLCQRHWYLGLFDSQST